MKLNRKIFYIVCVAIFSFALSLILSFLSAKKKAIQTVEPYRQYIEYDYGQFCITGYSEYESPCWVFYFSDPNAFDGSTVRVLINVIGEKVMTYPKNIQINTNYNPDASGT